MITLDGAERWATHLEPPTGLAARARGTTADVIGAAVAAAGLLAVAGPLVEGLAFGWSIGTWLVLALSPLLLDAFRHYEKYLVETGREPLLDPSFFQPPLH
jgi:hypothetical protein